jgi:hypothetical protein
MQRPLQVTAIVSTPTAECQLMSMSLGSLTPEPEPKEEVTEPSKRQMSPRKGKRLLQLIDVDPERREIVRQ